MSLYFGQRLAILAMLLQISVWLQPFLSEDLGVSPLCIVVTQALQADNAPPQPAHHHAQATDASHLLHHHPQPVFKHDQNSAQCDYCLAYSHLIPFNSLGLYPVLIRIQMRFMAFVQRYKHIYFQLLQLFLTPQGRAPPAVMWF